MDCGGVNIFALVYRFGDIIWLQWDSCTLFGYLETCAPPSDLAMTSSAFYHLSDFWPCYHSL